MPFIGELLGYCIVANRQIAVTVARKSPTWTRVYVSPAAKAAAYDLVKTRVEAGAVFNHDDLATVDEVIVKYDAVPGQF